MWGIFASEACWHTAWAMPDVSNQLQQVDPALSCVLPRKTMTFAFPLLISHLNFSFALRCLFSESLSYGFLNDKAG